MKWLFTGSESAAPSRERGFVLIAVEQKYKTRSRNWKEASSIHCRALITHHSDRDVPPLYLVVSISHLAVNSVVKHHLLALYCV